MADRGTALNSLIVIRKLGFSLLLSCYALLLSKSPVLANDTALNEGAYGAEPLDLAQEKESDIQMVEEHLRFEFGKKFTAVVVKFRFKNTSQGSVKQLTGFPDIRLGNDRPDGYGMHLPATMGDIENMQTYVNGKPVKSELRYGYVKPDPKTGRWQMVDKKSGDRIAWHIISIIIPPNEELELERRYRSRNGVDGASGNIFRYVTQTGAGWQGPIGKLVANVILKDGLTLDDLHWPGKKEPYHFTMSPGRQDWQIINDSHISLTWNQFEPRDDASKRFLQIVSRPYSKGETITVESKLRSSTAKTQKGFYILTLDSDTWEWVVKISTSSGLIQTDASGRIKDFQDGDKVWVAGKALGRHTLEASEFRRADR